MPRVLATRILNMVPTKKVDKTPYELWYGKVPNLSYLKVWGCEALVKRDTPDKLEQRSVKYAEFFEKRLISQEISGRAVDLEEIQEEEDTTPSEITSNIPQEVEGFEPPQEEVIPIRRQYGMVPDDLPPGCKPLEQRLFKKKTRPWMRKVCKLQRSIYGLKQASRSWNKRFDEEIKRFGFAQNLDEPCVYQKASGSNVTFLILTLDLGKNLVFGLIPFSIGQSTSMEVLYLSDNQLNGTLPESIGRLPLLKEQDVSNNQLGGSLPYSIRLEGSKTKPPVVAGLHELVNVQMDLTAEDIKFIRAKELFVWSPSFKGVNDAEFVSDDDSVNGDEEKNDDMSKNVNLEDESDIEGVSETVFGDQDDSLVQEQMEPALISNRTA
ncbi:retrotransposon protein, putative, ty1-copia subclass, partial [Tanacetum coccineum]